jgi:hypothetical protein
MERDFQSALLPFALREKGLGVEGREMKQDFFDSHSAKFTLPKDVKSLLIFRETTQGFYNHGLRMIVRVGNNSKWEPRIS